MLKGYIHRNGYLRVVDVKIDKMKAIADVDGTGANVYTFDFEKAANGNLQLKSYQFTVSTDNAQGLENAVLVDKTTAPAFDNSTFTTGNIVFKMTADGNANTLAWDIKMRQTGTKFIPPNQIIPIFGEAPEFTKPYYALDKAGWKAENEFIGSWVPSWKATTSPVMLVERGDIIYQCTKQ